MEKQPSESPETNEGETVTNSSTPPTTAPLIGKKPVPVRTTEPAGEEVGPINDSETEPADEFEGNDKTTIPQDELAEHQARIEYLRGLRGEKSSPKKRNIIIGLVILALLVGAAVYWLYFKNSPAPEPAKTTPITSQTTPPPASTQTANTKPFSSSSLGLNFNYPADWTVAEADNVITVTSPKMDLTNADGESAGAKVIMTIQKKQSSLPDFKSGDATAVIGSEKISYTNPSPTQRAQTYLSYLQYATTTTHGGLDGIYISGNLGYQKGQSVPMTDIAKVDPLVTVTFKNCADQTCESIAAANPLTIASASWADPIKTTVDAMLASLSIQ